ncbi:MAG: L-histidine N(alpha)-methyltransferase [Alphaproteobacteria bacterium]|jgi:dimethylhistidine N-methyltransferase|nr:L-histidine N(alpha)-methyltransferase [Alphaproteobacteria bacterium]
MPARDVIVPEELDGFHDHDADGAFLDDVLHGLAQPQKWLPCKYLYDAAGSQLFDRICELPSYYPTRTEQAILSDRRHDIARLAGPGTALVELGSGSSVKVRTLLDALESPAAYVPIDISRTHLLAAAADLAGDHPGLPVVPVCADYTRPFALPPEAAGRRLGFFPGSTIGNLEPEDARAFLAGVAETLEPGAGFVIGVDLKKDPAILHPAYDDPEGVTAAFNLNLLARINRELGGDFDRDGFVHEARWNDAAGRIEMHLVSRAAQTVLIAGHVFTFQDGESIHTESSHKHTLAGFRALAERAGWSPVAAWTDPDGLFSVHYLTA